MAFWLDESAQDVTEFTLLVAFVTLISAGLLLLSGDSVKACWSDSQSNLDRAERMARDGH
ncbi:MAG: hypothetical protein ACE15B_12015 [Bryobacteraceae bacterium]